MGNFPRILLPAPDGGGWLDFAPPRQILAAETLDEVVQVVAAAENARRQGKFVAGFVAYDAAPAYDSAHRIFPPSASKLRSSPPLAWFAIADEPPQPSLLPRDDSHLCGRWRGRPRAEYLAALNSIQHHIAAGDAYQVNFTYPLRAAFAGCPMSMFAALAARQPSPWRFFAETESWAVCSASPECFVEKRGESLWARPMKGTRPGGPKAAVQLAASEKDRAENLMIVDMTRNDMSRLPDARHVRAESLLDIHTYPTVAQMTSTVACKTAAGMDGIFAAMFPPASVTGAPKIAAMQIIAGLEKESRGVYCGVCGWGDNGGFQFNVAIRTAVIDKKNGVVRYDVGSGVVADSSAAGEWRECKNKAAILVPPSPPCLLETMRADNSGVVLLKNHLQRIAASARVFGFRFARRRAEEEIEKECKSLSAPATLRLQLFADGTINLQRRSLPPRKKIRACLSEVAVDSANLLLRHKTGRRGIYETALAAAKARGFDDAVLQNEKGELTETCIANLAIQLGGRWLTPPLSCGLLPGVFRRQLLAQKNIAEKIVGADDLRRAEKIMRFNAVRGEETMTVAL